MHPCLSEPLQVQAKRIFVQISEKFGYVKWNIIKLVMNKTIVLLLAFRYARVRLIKGQISEDALYISSLGHTT